jgi:cytoskeletal protein RodZ
MEGEDLGLTLRRARVACGLTLDALAHRTNIAPKVLEALERGALNEVPGGLFTRGYVRAYAAEVGLDGEQIVQYLPKPGAASDDILLEQLRERYPVRNRGRKPLIQFLLVVARLTCLLSLLTREPAPAVTGDVHDEVQSPGLSMRLDWPARPGEAA